MNRVIFVLVSSSLISFPLTACALESDSDQFDPQAQEVIQRMSKYYQEVDHFSVELSFKSSFKAQGINEEYIDDYQLALKHPNKLSVRSKGDSGGTVVCDGKNLFAFSPAVHKYTLTSAPNSFDEIATEEAAFIMGASAVVFDICAADPYQRVIDGVSGMKLLEDDVIDEVQCHRVKLLHEEVSIDMWVQAGEQPLLRKIVRDMSNAIPNEGPMGEVSIETVITLDKWVIDGEIPEERFAIVPPEGVEEIDSFFLAAGGEKRMHPLVGQQAPDFELNTLDGGKANLAAHKGKNIVIVDFWATWCGPCIEAIPTLIEVAKQFADRAVILYSVNVLEDPAYVKEYIEQQNWDSVVVTDIDGSVAMKYGVTGIPQTVIIDKQGKVQVVHVGFGFGLKERLSSELEAIIEGKDLAGEASK